MIAGRGKISFSREVPPNCDPVQSVHSALKSKLHISNTKQSQQVLSIYFCICMCIDVAMIINEKEAMNMRWSEGNT